MLWKNGRSSESSLLRFLFGGSFMKQLITAFSMCQTMFCRIPFPLRKWEEAARPYLLLFLPLVGLEIGVLWVLADLVLRHLGIPAPVYGFVMTAIPVLLTGGIHLDGFMDVADAIGSWRDLEKRRAILKDSHVGAVAVIWVAFLLLGYFAVFSSVADGRTLGCLVLVPVVSRCCSSLAVWNLRSMSTSQYAGSITPGWCRWIVWGILVGAIAAAFVCFGTAALAIGAAGYALSLSRAYRLLEGMNGDISGFCIHISELCAAAALILL